MGQALGFGVEYALVLRNLLNDFLVELLLLLLLRQRLLHLAILQLVFFKLLFLVDVLLHFELLTDIICNSLLLGLCFKNLCDRQVKHPITQLSLLLHLTVDARESILLDLGELFYLPDGFFEKEFENVLVVDIKDVDELDIFESILLSLLTILVIA